jgi:hypothetical protein
MMGGKFVVVAKVRHSQRMNDKLRVNLMVRVMAKLTTSHQTMTVVATAERVQMKQVFFAVTHSIYHA